MYVTTNSKPTMTVWCNERHSPKARAFLSALFMHSIEWKIIIEPWLADLWCLVDFQEDVAISNTLIKLYYQTSNRPKVIYLGSVYTSPLVENWIFFKSPVNVTILHNWLDKHFQPSKTQSAPNVTMPAFALKNTHDASSSIPEAISAPVSASLPEVNKTNLPRWYTQPFKLTYWPNMSLYSDSPELVMLCSALMRDWSMRESVYLYNIQPSMVDILLQDAEAEGNLIYQNASSFSTPTQFNTSTADTPINNPKPHQDSSWGLLKRLFKKLGGI